MVISKFTAASQWNINKSGAPMKNNGFLRLFLPFFVSVTAVLSVAAQVEVRLMDGRTLASVEASAITSNVSPGTVIILGENHGLQAHRDQHIIVLNQLRAQGLKVSVGMEFVNFTDQSFLNQYLAGELNDEQFLKQIKWQGFDFKFYKDQILFPQISLGEWTLGLNIPRFVTSKIAKTGVESLTPEEQELMPPGFQMGRASYKERFARIMHVPAGPTLDRYFAAQSTWDDAMAYQATQFLNNHPDQVLVIIVGEFHAQYGGGLADRILARRPQTPITTILPLWAVAYKSDGTEIPMTEDEIQNEIQPSETEGPRGEFIWVAIPRGK